MNLWRMSAWISGAALSSASSPGTAARAAG
jgi:hypothetical protein